MSDREIRTILLVDGSATSIFYLAMLLKRLEYKVVTAQSAEDALRAMDESLPSIVLTAVALPRMSGVDFIKRLKDSARFKAIPVVVLLSEKEAEKKNVCLGIGCNAWLANPVEPDQLYRTLQSVSETIPRKDIRLTASLKVIVGDGTATGGAKRTEHATAISEGGIYVRTLDPLPRNVITPVRIFLNGREVGARAEVLYTHHPGDGSSEAPGMGMKFVELSNADREVIRLFIKEHLTKDIAPA